MNYRRDIDGLRTLAVVPVVLYHAGVAGFSGGFVGVDIFFVISGYLITTIIWRELAEERFSILNFYERRARRILPALFAVILFCGLVSSVILTPDEFKRFAQSILGSVFFFQNFLLMGEAGYFDAASETKPLLHIWSLAVEEQFYILFPLALIILTRLVPRFVVKGIMLLAIVLSLIVSSFLLSHSPVFNFYMLPTRAWELLCGGLLAVWTVVTPISNKRLLNAVSVIGMGAIILAIVLYSTETPFPGYSALPPVLGAVALIWAGEHSIIGRLLSWRPFVFIGLISYSLYLWHWPLFAFHKLIFPDETSVLHVSILIILSFVLAVSSWRFIEQPFRKRGGTWDKRSSVFGFSASAGLVFSLVAVMILSGDGWKWRVSPVTVIQAEVATQKRISDSQCQVDEVLFTLRGRERGFCKLGKSETSDPDVLVWGDSHVGAWFTLLDEAFSQAGVSAIAITTAGCPIAFELDRADTSKGGCLEAAAAVRNYIENAKTRYVLVVGSWFGVLSSKNTVYEGNVSMDNDSRLANVTGAIAETGDVFGKLGITSGFLMTVPGARHSVPEAMFRKAQLHFYPEIRRSWENYHQIMAPIEASAEAHYDYVLKTDDDLCVSGYCDIERDGELLYYDSNHPSLYLNQLMLPHILGQLKEFFRTREQED